MLPQSVSGRAGNTQTQSSGRLLAIVPSDPANECLVVDLSIDLLNPVPRYADRQFLRLLLHKPKRLLRSYTKYPGALLTLPTMNDPLSFLQND